MSTMAPDLPDVDFDSHDSGEVAIGWEDTETVWAIDEGEYAQIKEICNEAVHPSTGEGAGEPLEFGRFHFKAYDIHGAVHNVGDSVSLLFNRRDAVKAFAALTQGADRAKGRPSAHYAVTVKEGDTGWFNGYDQAGEEVEFALPLSDRDTDFAKHMALIYAMQHAPHNPETSKAA